MKISIPQLKDKEKLLRAIEGIQYGVIECGLATGNDIILNYQHELRLALVSLIEHYQELEG